MKLLNLEGLSTFWEKVKSYFDKNLQGIEVEYIDELFKTKIEFYNVNIPLYMNVTYYDPNSSTNSSSGLGLDSNTTFTQIDNIVIDRHDVSNIIPDNISELTITNYDTEYPNRILYINDNTCTISFNFITGYLCGVQFRVIPNKVIIDTSIGSDTFTITRYNSILNGYIYN